MAILLRVFLAGTLLSVAALAQSHPQSESKKLSEILTAAEQGDAKAQFRLADHYELGKGVPRDYVEAVQWYAKAAAQGHAGAQYSLGRIFEFAGRLQAGFSEDYTEAAKWYRMAAEQGYARGQLKLAFAYSLGIGVPQDYIQAHMWANLASARSTGRAEQKLRADLREAIAAKMTPEQIGEAQRLAREWKPTKEE